MFVRLLKEPSDKMAIIFPFGTKFAESLSFCSVNFFQEILEDVVDIDLVVNLKLREDVLLEKCLGRRLCSECGKNFNVATINVKGENGNPDMLMPPLLPPPGCMSKLVTRADDIESVVKERLRIYYEKVLFHSLSMLSINEIKVFDRCDGFVLILMCLFPFCSSRVSLSRNSTAVEVSSWNSICPEGFPSRGQSCFRLSISMTTRRSSALQHNLSANLCLRVMPFFAH